MSLVSGPGRAHSAESGLPTELELVVEKHVQYIQSLDKVSSFSNDISLREQSANTCSEKTSLSIG